MGRDGHVLNYAISEHVEVNLRVLPSVVKFREHVWSFVAVPFDPLGPKRETSTAGRWYSQWRCDSASPITAATFGNPSQSDARGGTVVSG